jgi:A/G-specific adenine glycosylase
MLQQTTVATVKPRFGRFLARWPTIHALAAASDEEILSEWAGLGYYARARNLIACAREIAARGGFPTSAEELRSLPGVGAYTSGAIAAIAFGEKVAAVDTNVRRVIARLDGICEPGRGEVERRLLEMMQFQSPGDLVQAMMDLGATICRPKRPRCGECPLRSQCAAFASGDPEAFPTMPRRAERPHRYGVAWWIERDARVWLVRRPTRGLLGGMSALPGSDWNDAAPKKLNPLATVRHVFTHFSLDLSVAERAENLGEGWWQPIAELDEAGLPTLYLKAAREVLAGRQSFAA